MRKRNVTEPSMMVDSIEPRLTFLILAVGLGLVAEVVNIKVYAPLNKEATNRTSNDLAIKSSDKFRSNREPTYFLNTRSADEKSIKKISRKGKLNNTPRTTGVAVC